MTISATTDRGAIRFEITERVRALSVRADDGDRLRDLIILAVPRSRNLPPPHAGLTPLGPDHDAIRAADRADRLYDLGLDHESTSVCLRTTAPPLKTEFAERVGQSWTRVVPELGPLIHACSPTRVVLTPITRTEVFTPITPPDSHEAAGPSAWLLPDWLGLGRDQPDRLNVPEAFVPCVIFEPSPSRAGEPARLTVAPVVSF